MTVLGDPSNPYSGLTVELIIEADNLIGNSDVRTASRKTSCTGNHVDPIGCSMVRRRLLNLYNNGLGRPALQLIPGSTEKNGGPGARRGPLLSGTSAKR